MIAVDTNVLVYAHRREAAEHDTASALIRNLAEGRSPWAIPWPCLYEFFSVVTNPRIWKGAASTSAQAWTQIDAWRRSPSLHLLAEVSSDTQFEVLEHLVLRPRVRGPVVHDARIAALCVVHGVDYLVSRDRDFSLFPELVVKNPFAPPA